MLSKVKNRMVALSACALMSVSSAVVAEGTPHFEVTITNLTHAISFTPILVASHRAGVSIFESGSAASDELSSIAEGGDVVPMTDMLSANAKVRDVQNSGDLLPPGESVTVSVAGGPGPFNFSLASMLLPTNDGFIGLSDVKAPKYGSLTYYSPGYDAGTETNDELCVTIPGPTCGGEPFSPNDAGEGFVHVHRGIHGIGDLSASVYDWRNPVAKITVTRTK